MNNNFKATAKAAAIFSITAALTACGGGGGDGGDSSASKGTAEGLYAGSLTGSNYTAFNTAVLEDGQYWTLYGTQSGGVLLVHGIIQGQGTSTNGTFTSSNLKDFGFAPAISGTLSASYVAGTSISGTANFSGSQVGIAGAAIAATVIDYAVAAQQSSVAGAWTLGSTSGTTISATVASNGSLTGQDDGGCAMTGTIVPRPSGKNIFNVQLLFANSNSCALPGQTGTGIGVYSTLASGQHQLIIAVTDASRSYGSAAIGVR